MVLAGRMLVRTDRAAYPRSWCRRCVPSRGRSCGWRCRTCSGRSCPAPCATSSAATTPISCRASTANSSLGATIEEQDYDTAVTAGGVYELLRDARELVPGITELPLIETRAALRPGSPDNAPLIGPTALPGLLSATGHYRHGVLLTPATADGVAEILATGTVPRGAGALQPPTFHRASPEMSAEHTMQLSVNGEPSQIAEGSTVADLVVSLVEAARDGNRGGIAVAVNESRRAARRLGRHPARGRRPGRDPDRRARRLSSR